MLVSACCAKFSAFINTKKSYVTYNSGGLNEKKLSKMADARPPLYKAVIFKLYIRRRRFYLAQ